MQPFGEQMRHRCSILPLVLVAPDLVLTCHATFLRRCTTAVSFGPSSSLLQTLCSPSIMRSFQPPSSFHQLSQSCVLSTRQVSRPCSLPLLAAHAPAHVLTPTAISSRPAVYSIFADTPLVRLRIVDVTSGSTSTFTQVWAGTPRPFKQLYFVKIPERYGAGRMQGASEQPRPRQPELGRVTPGPHFSPACSSHPVTHVRSLTAPHLDIVGPHGHVDVAHGVAADVEENGDV
eukprot:364785-Chlamydomonas_euryale.AAC.15